jgi:hypothetical protein
MAATLNAAADSGMKVRVCPGAIIAESSKAGGYVLVGQGGRWKPAYLTYDPLAPGPDLSGDGLDD